MFKWLLNKKNKRPINRLYLSIDARSIGIAFLSNDKCIFYDRKFYLNNEAVKPIEVLFKETLISFKNKHNFLLDEICIILENPWVTESHSHIKEKRSKEFVVTKSFLSSFIDKEFTFSKKQNNPYIIEKVLLDGHVHTDPLNKQAKEIEIYLTKFTEDYEFVSFIKNTIENIWDKTKITFTFGSSFIIRNGLTKIKTNDIYIVLGSSDTIIKLYSANTLKGNVIIPFGFCNILEKLGQKWDTPYFSTISWLNMFLKNELNTNEMARIKNDIWYVFKPFSENLGKLEIFDPNIPQPARPVRIFGLHKIWNELFLYLLDLEINKKHINIKNTDIISESGDRLLDFYIKEDF